MCQSGYSSEPRPARRRDAEPRQAEDEDIEEVGLDHSFLSVSLSAQDYVCSNSTLERIFCLLLSSTGYIGRRAKFEFA